MQNALKSNLDSWISEFPTLKAVILHPKHARFFMSHECPGEKDSPLEHEWNQVISQLRE